MGVYIKGVTKQELKEIFGKACILYNSADLVDVETPLIPDKIERGSVTMICDAVIIHCDDYFDMMLKSTAIDSGSWEKFITNETRKGEWIPCSERMPEDPNPSFTYGSKTYQVTNERGGVIALRWRKTEVRGKTVMRWERSDGIIYHGDVLAWKPLSEPWEGADDDSI